MYFLKDGVVNITIKGKKVNELTEGSYFGGEYSLFKKVFGKRALILREKTERKHG